MVRLAGFAVINEEGRAEHDASQQTIEALESRVIDEYERALREIQANNSIEAEAAFRSVLSDQLVIDGATEQLQRLRFLSLKNLAGVVASPSRAHEALQLFALAAQEDASDVALWDRYGTLAAETGEWAVAKSAFEEALSRDPRHPTISTKLLQILVHIGDTTRANAFAKYCLEQDPWHPLARRVVKNKTGEDLVAAGTALVSLPSVYTGPATPDCSTATLFPTAYIATVTLEKASWRVLLRQCIKLLSNPLAAVANVKFVAPQAIAVASPAAAAASALPLPPAEVAPQEPAGVAIEVEKPLVESIQSPQEPAGELAVADPDDTKKKGEAQGAQPTDNNKNAQEAVSPQRRSVRTTKCRHKPQHNSNAATNTATTTNGATIDPFNLIRTLAPSMCPPQRPESAQLAAPPEEFIKPRAGSSKVAVTTTAVDEAEEVHSCELLHVRSISAVHAAITLVLHLTQPQHAARLPQLAGTSGALLKLVSMLEKQQQWKGQGMAPEQYLVLGELFSDAATTSMRAHASNSSISSAAAAAASNNKTPSAAASAQQNLNELNLAEFQRGGALWLSRFRASHLAAGPASDVRGSTAAGGPRTSRTKNNNIPTAITGAEILLIEARYWWARGRLNEAASRPTEAYECYSQCSALLLQQQKYMLQSILAEGKTSEKQLRSGAAKNTTTATATTTSSIAETTTIEIKLPHCCLDATITAKSVQAKLELLQLHDVLTEAELRLSQNKDAEAAAILAPVVLACSDTEYLMAAADRPTWIKSLRTLRNAADKVKDSVLALRCHLRLLRAGLPLVPSTIEAVLRDPDSEQATGGSESHLAHFFIDTQHFVATGAAADLTAAAVFLGDPVNFKKIKNTLCTSDTATTSTTPPSALHPTFELHALRMLIKQSLAFVHSCGAALHATPDRRSTLNTRALVLRHSMSDAAVVGLQLWLLDTASKCTPGYVLEWCYGLADALAGAGALTERHGALPAVVLPHLQNALSTAESMLGNHEGQVSTAVNIAVPFTKKKAAAATATPTPSLHLTDDEIEELKDVVESLHCGVDNCLLWLYGVRLPGVDEEEWGGSVVITTISGNNNKVTAAGCCAPNAAVAAATAAAAGNNSNPAITTGSLPDTSTSIFIPPGGLRPLASQDAALVMWSSVSDHLVGQSVSALQKHKGFLENMAKLFPSLPPQLQTNVDAVFEEMARREPPELDENLEKKGLKNPMDGILEAALLEQERKQQKQGNEGEDLSFSPLNNWTKYLPIYRTLFHLLSLIQPSTPSIIDQAGFPEYLGILDPGADQILSTQIFAPLLADLTMNPRKYPERWSSLALLYHEVADLMLIKAAHDVPTRQWLYRTDLHRRVNSYRRLGHWCTAIDALCISESQKQEESDENLEEKAELLELSGSKRYNEVNDVPPQYNQLDLRPLRDDASLLEATASALRAYKSAELILPDEWAFKINIGRCLRRLGRAPQEYFPLFARACQLAIKHHNGGLVDPVYTLHNARYKLVQQAQKENAATKSVLYGVGKFCFLKETQTKLKDICPRFFDSTETSYTEMSDQQATACCSALLDDCTAALEWCLEKQKGYHRASLALAKFHAANGDSEQVIKYLAPLFSRYKAIFTLNMSPIVATTSRNSSKQKRRGGVGGGDNKTTAADGTTTDATVTLTMESDSELDQGICPTAKNIGTGVLESEVVFISRVRKALLLYLTALFRTNTRDVLAAADLFFDNIKLNKDAVQTFWMSKPGFEDIRKLARGYHVLCLLSSAFDICPLVLFILPPESKGERREAGPEPRLQRASPNVSPSKQAAIRAQARNLNRQHRHLRTIAGQINPAIGEPVLQELYKLWSEHIGIVVSSGNVALDISSGASGSAGGYVPGMDWWEPAVAAPARFALDVFTTTSAASEGTEEPSQTAIDSSAPLPHAESLAAVLQGPASQTVTQTYAQLYIHLLAVHGGTEKIKSMLAPLKRRFRKIKLCGEGPRKLIIQLCSAGVGSLVAETKELMASAAALAPVLSQPAEPLRDIVADNAAAAVATAAGGGSGTPGGVHTNDALAGLQSPTITAPSPSIQRPNIPPPPPVPAAAMIPTTLNQAQMHMLQNRALHRCQQYMLGVIQENAARGINLPPSVVQFMQERRYTQEVAELQRQACAQLNQARQAAQFQHSEAMRHYAIQVKMIEQAHQRALSGLAATAPTTPEERVLQDRIITAMQQVILFIRAAPWLSDDDMLPSLKSARAAADDLRFELLRCYLVLGHINLPTTRQQAFKMCDEVIKLHKKGTMGGGGGGGGSSSRPTSAAAPAAAPVFNAVVTDPHEVAPGQGLQQATASMQPAPPTALTNNGQGEPSPKRQRVEAEVINLVDDQH
ncbi:hypothetical protein Ndes2437B_g02257 [Nannochloris sp. 'desiccata']